MTSCPQTELLRDSVISRTIEGTINYWSSNAEELYGWTKEEALGKISHNLLQTQFPKPLNEIEAELVKSGCWEGKLVHTTRNGRRVLVESRWTLELNGQSQSLVEINACSMDDNVENSELPKDRPGRIVARAPVDTAALLANMGSMVLLGVAVIFIGLVSYGLFGHLVIKAIYEEKLPSITNWLMAGRTVTALEDYVDIADYRMLLWTLRVVIGLLLVAILVKKPIGSLVALSSALLFSFILFCLIEWFPVLMKPLQNFNYYSIKHNWVADEVLSYRGKPFTHYIAEGFRGDLYSPKYAIEVAPINVESFLDKDGFRNSHTPASPDIVVLGDSYVEDGIDETDTFPRQLEKNLPGLTVHNLAKAGYGPQQYVEVLKRYGIPKKPKYALLGFFEGNDLLNLASYVRWKNGVHSEEYARIYDILSTQDLLHKYTIAFREISRQVRKTIQAQIAVSAPVFFNRISFRPETEKGVHPEVAVLKLGDQTHKVVLRSEIDSRSTEELLRSEEFTVLRQLLAEYKNLCIQNQTVPIILYFPTADHVYAKYSTQQSGKHWQERRSRQIAAEENLEAAVRAAVQQLKIEFISVTPALKRAAEEGKLLYYPTDTHWNPEGKALAARFVADVLKAKFLIK